MDRGDSRRRYAKNVDSQGLTNSRFGIGRAEQSVLKLRKIKRGVAHVGNSRYVAFHGSYFSFMPVADGLILLHESLVTRLSGEALGVVWARSIRRHVDCRKETSLASQEWVWARNQVLPAREYISVAHVGIQRTPARVRSSSSLPVSIGAPAKRRRRMSPNLRGPVAESKAADKARSLAAGDLLRAACGSATKLVRWREGADGLMGERAEDCSGSGGRRSRRGLSTSIGDRIPKYGSNIIWGAWSGDSPDAIRRVGEREPIGSFVEDEVAHFGLVVAWGIHANEGKRRREKISLDKDFFKTAESEKKFDA